MPHDTPPRLRDADHATVDTALQVAIAHIDGHVLDLVERIEAEHGFMPSVEDLTKIKALMDARSAVAMLRRPYISNRAIS